MKDIDMKNTLTSLVFAIGVLFLQAQVPAGPQTRSILITDVTVHIGNGKEIQDGAVGFREGKIDYVGSTSLAPVMGAEKASDQPLAWNSGTTGMTASREDRPRKSGAHTAMACSTFERCEYSKPFGLPVVPEV